MIAGYDVKKLNTKKIRFNIKFFSPSYSILSSPQNSLQTILSSQSSTQKKLNTKKSDSISIFFFLHLTQHCLLHKILHKQYCLLNLLHKKKLN